MGEGFLCEGFSAAGLAAGIKKGDALDLALIYSKVPVNVAGMFTRNLVAAAPVKISRARVESGVAQAIVANAGNANCCNGLHGMAAARAVTDSVASLLNLEDERVLVASTGVIGAPLPTEKIQAALPQLVAALRPDGFEDAARAIMTTDTVPKLVVRRGEIDGRAFSLVAIAKGAGMIRPDMATMLCFVCTDADVPADMLKRMLTPAVERSLNRITIDGDTSTNDTVFLLANGMSGVHIRTDDQCKIFQQLLDEMLLEIARRLVKDGEGVTKVVDIKVTGAASDVDAFRIADTVAHSPLVKTAFFGEDANWGRIMGALGRAGAQVDPDRVDIYFDDVQMVAAGQGCGQERESLATAVMKQAEFTTTIDLNLGQGQASILTCDYSIDYIKINADYRS